MRPKTTFRLVLKAIGVMIVGFSLPGLASGITSSIWAIVNQRATFPGAPGYAWFYQTSMVLGPLLQAALGLYLVFGGKWLVNMCIPSNRPHCPECDYELTDPSAEVCSECGVRLTGDE